MTPEQLPDDLSELERELAARRRLQASATLRSRVISAVERELSPPQAGGMLRLWLRRQRWRLVFAGGMAAAVVVAAFIAWHRSAPVPPAAPGRVGPPLAVAPSTEPDELLLTWGTGRALDDSPETLEDLLKKRSVEDRAPSAPLRAFTRIDAEFRNPKGDM